MKFSRILTFVAINIVLVATTLIGGVYHLYFKNAGISKASVAWKLYEKLHDPELNLNAGISSYSKQETLNRFKRSKLLKNHKEEKLPKKN